MGEVSGGVIFGLLGSKTIKYGRDPIVIMGFVVHMIAFFLIFLNLPNLSPFGATSDIAYLNPPNAALALTCSFLLGFGDSCFNTQIYSLLGGVFAKKSAEAFSIFKFTQVRFSVILKFNLLNMYFLLVDRCCSQLRVLVALGSSCANGNPCCVRNSWHSDFLDG